MQYLVALVLWCYNMASSREYLHYRYQMGTQNFLNLNLDAFQGGDIRINIGPGNVLKNQIEKSYKCKFQADESREIQMNSGQLAKVRSSFTTFVHPPYG